MPSSFAPEYAAFWNGNPVAGRAGLVQEMSAVINRTGSGPAGGKSNAGLESSGTSATVHVSCGARNRFSENVSREARPSRKRTRSAFASPLWFTIERYVLYASPFACCTV